MSGPADLGDDPVTDLVHRADLDGLVRLVDSFTSTREWSELLRLRDRARAAVETGRQLWPAATLAEYRLALHSPPEWAARVRDGESGRFTIGPLAEVVASRLTWVDLDGLVTGPVAAGVAHERVARGEDLTGLVVPPVIELPLALASWERPTRCPTTPMTGSTTGRRLSASTGRARPRGRNPTVIDDDESARAFRQLVETWTDSSTGRCGFVCVEGDSLDAVAALGLRRARTAPVSFGDAVDLLAWAGATGAARGRRRGAALGRFGVWWLLGALCDLGESWPPDPELLGAAAGALEWSWWDGFEPSSGWRLSLSACDRESGLSWAMSAADEA